MDLNAEDLNLFLVVLGGRANGCHVELHDVRWVIGKSIEDTFSQLKKEWFGQKEGLHLDSYMIIKFIDGYEIKIIKKNKQQPTPSIRKEKKLWFVNLGGYNKESLQELHRFGLTVATSAFEAKSKAKNTFDFTAKNIHVDNLRLFNQLERVDNCYSIEEVIDHQIFLMPDKLNRAQPIRPDWYGYQKIS